MGEQRDDGNGIIFNDRRERQFPTTVHKICFGSRRGRDSPPVVLYMYFDWLIEIEGLGQPWRRRSSSVRRRSLLDRSILLGWFSLFLTFADLEEIFGEGSRERL